MSSTYASEEVSWEDLSESNLVSELLSNVTSAIEAAARTSRGSSPSGETTTTPTHDPGVSVLSTLLNSSALALMENATSTKPSSNTSGTSKTYHYYGPVLVGVFCFCLSVFVLLSVLGNSFVILTIVRHRGMRTRTNLLLTNLAIADIMVAILDMPVAIITLIYGDWKFPKSFCYLNGFTVGLGLMTSVHTLMWISIHKYISITRPFSRAITRRRIGYMIATCWIWAIAYNLTPLIGFTEMVYKKGASQCGPVIPRTTGQKIHSYINTLCNLVLPLSVMSYCYYNIFAEVKRHLLRMRDSSNLDFRNTVLQQQRISLTLFIVLACFIICWLPYVFYSMSLVLGIGGKIDVILNPVAYLFGYMNSACNPIIYAFRSPSFRRGYKDIIYGRAQGVPGARTRWSIRNRRYPAFLQTFRGSLVRGAASERSHRYDNAAVAGSECEDASRINNSNYKKVVLDQRRMPKGLAKTTSTPDYDIGIKGTNGTTNQDDLFHRSTKKIPVEQEAYSESYVYAYATLQKTCPDSPPRTRHKSEQIGNRRIPEIQLTLTGDEMQRPVFPRRPINHARDVAEAKPVSPNFPRKALVQNYAHDVLEENTCLFAEPLGELDREVIDVSILGRRLFDGPRKKSPDEIRSWYSEELLDSEKGRSEDTFDMASVSASNPNLISPLGGDNRPERKDTDAFLGVQGSKIRSNSHREVLLVNSESNLLGPKKTASADDIDVGQDLEGDILPKSIRNRVYTEGNIRGGYSRTRTSKHRLMWQASVEGLGDSPLQSRTKLCFWKPERKIFHVRRIASGQVSNDNQSWALKKTNEGNLLGLASLLTTVRRSLSDFFSAEPSGDTENKKSSSAVPES